MNEQRFCNPCTAPDSKECVMRRVEEINAMADTIPEASDDFTNRDIALKINKEIAKVEEEGKKHGCTGRNKITGANHFDNKYNKFT